MVQNTMRRCGKAAQILHLACTASVIGCWGAAMPAPNGAARQGSPWSKPARAGCGPCLRWTLRLAEILNGFPPRRAKARHFQLRYQ